MPEAENKFTIVPVNCPFYRITRRLFDSENEAEEFISDYVFKKEPKIFSTNDYLVIPYNPEEFYY